MTRTTRQSIGVLAVAGSVSVGGGVGLTDGVAAGVEAEELGEGSVLGVVDGVDDGSLLGVGVGSTLELGDGGVDAQ